MAADNWAKEDLAAGMLLPVSLELVFSTEPLGAASRIVALEGLGNLLPLHATISLRLLCWVVCRTNSIVDQFSSCWENFWTEVLEVLANVETKGIRWLKGEELWGNVLLYKCHWIVADDSGIFEADAVRYRENVRRKVWEVLSHR